MTSDTGESAEKGIYSEETANTFDYVLKGNTMGAEQTQRKWVKLIVFTCAGGGYASAIITARHLTLAGVVLLTATTLAWLLLFHFLFRTQRAPSLWGASVLTVCACLTVLAVFLGMGCDWLLLVTIAGVIVMSSPLFFSIIASLALWLASALMVFVASGALNSTQFNLFAAFLFVLIFTFTLRHFLLARTQMQHLVTTLAHSKAELEAAHL